MSSLEIENISLRLRLQELSNEIEILKRGTLSSQTWFEALGTQIFMD